MELSSSATRFSFVLFLVLLAFQGLNAEARRGRGRSKVEAKEDGGRVNSKVNRGFNVDFSKEDNEDATDRQRKFFPIFNVVSFRNTPCTSNAGTTGSGNTRNGTCYTTSECITKSGQASGNCAAGFGVCCVFIVTTGTTITENCTYIQNPNFPSTDTSANAITYTVQKCSNDVCFLRLDFETFTLQGVGGTDIVDEGVCLDTFQVTSPTTQTIPTICGQNGGEHIYVDIGANSGDTATLAFAFTGSNAARSWDIKVTQVECSNANAPPNTCLQYQTGLTGRIQTFNYNSATDNHLNNQVYSVCIRPEFGFCCVQYTVCRDQAMGFTLDPVKTPDVDDMCLTVDHIAIPQSSATCDRTGGASVATQSRYCGMNLNTIAAITVNQPICDCTAPFTVDIFTDNTADPAAIAGSMNTIQSRGVCLEYTQIPC